MNLQSTCWESRRCPVPVPLIIQCYNLSIVIQTNIGFLQLNDSMEGLKSSPWTCEYDVFNRTDSYLNLSVFSWSYLLCQS